MRSIHCQRRALPLLIYFGVVAFANVAECTGAAAAQDTERKAPIAPGEAKSEKTDSEAARLVRQLGDSSFAVRQVASDTLISLGARAAFEVRVGWRDADLEVKRRCETIWPRLWESELARSGAERLAGYDRPSWAQFQKAAGDDADSRTLFIEMLADLRHFDLLEVLNVDPSKAGAEYVKQWSARDKTMRHALAKAKADEEGQALVIIHRNTPPRLRGVEPATSIPTRGEFAALLFLGTFPSTSVPALPEAELARLHNKQVFEFGLLNSKRDGVIPPALRRLFAAWAATRDHADTVQRALIDAVSFQIAEVAPLARRLAADPATAGNVRSSALLAVGRFGTREDVPLLEKAVADTRPFHVTSWPEQLRNDKRAHALVSDAAMVAILCLHGQRLGAVGFPLLRNFKSIDEFPDPVADYDLLGFFDDATRRAAHENVKNWLANSSKPASASAKATDSPRHDVKIEKPEQVKWGKAVNGLQAGIRVTRVGGERVVMDLEILVRNISSKEIEVIHLKQMGFRGRSIDGKVGARGYPIPNQLSLAAGIQMMNTLAPSQTYPLGVMAIFRPGDEGDFFVVLTPGAYRVGAERIQMALTSNQKDIFELATGYLDVEVPVKQKGRRAP